MGELLPLHILRKLGLSESEVQLFLLLHEHGGLTAAELVKLSHGKRPTVYYALRQLIERGLVHKTGSAAVERFQAEAPEKLLTILTFRRHEIDTLENQVQHLVKALGTSKVPHEGLPKVSFYEGDGAMKQVIMETLYCRGRHIDSFAPHDNFFWQIGQTFSANYVKERVTRKITTRNLWEKPLEPEIMLRSYKGLSEVRLLPQSMTGHFRTTVFLYDDVVMYISSRKSGYVLVVRSKEHHELMRAMYESLWQISKAITIK